MKRYLLPIAALFLGAASASASGFNLGWNDCPGGASYSLIETFACDTNSGSHTIVGSFVAPAGVVAMSANEVTINMQTGGTVLPDWWTFGTGQCRALASLHGNFDFTAGPFTCHDYWQGGAIGAMTWTMHPVSTKRCRFRGVFALPAGDPRITSVPEGAHVYSFKIIIDNAKSAGADACAGCGEEACIVQEEIRIGQPPPLPQLPRLLNPASTGHVVWQAWTTTDPQQQCPQVTPARSRTWGSIKALYR